MHSEKMIYFIYADFDNKIDADNIIKLYSTLKNKRAHKPFKLIILTAKPLNITNSNIIIIVEDLKIKNGNWVKSFINDYGNINDDYSKFCNKVGKKLSDFIS